MLIMSKVKNAASQKPNKTGLGSRPGPSIEMATMKGREAWLISDDWCRVRQFRRADGVAHSADTDPDPAGSGSTKVGQADFGPIDTGPAEGGPVDTGSANCGPADHGSVDI